MSGARPTAGTGPADAGPPALARRRVLLLLPAALAAGACSAPAAEGDDGPDPLIPLADAARADAALAAAAIAANPALAARVEPLRAARAEHAAALDAEVTRWLEDATPAPAAPPSPARPPARTALAQVRDALAASGRGAAELVPTMPPSRVGLVSSVAACCSAYAELLS